MIAKENVNAKIITQVKNVISAKMDIICIRIKHAKVSWTEILMTACFQLYLVQLCQIVKHIPLIYMFFSSALQDHEKFDLRSRSDHTEKCDLRSRSDHYEPKNVIYRS